MSKLFFRSHSNFSSLFLSLSHTHTLSLPVWNRKKSRKRSGSVIVVRCVFVGVGGVTTREEMKKCDDEWWWWWEWDRAFVSFSSSFAPFLCFLKKTKKFSSKRAVVLDFNDRTRHKFLLMTETKEWKKKREILSRERKREKKRDESLLSHYTTKKIGIYNSHHHHHHHHHENTVIMSRE